MLCSFCGRLSEEGLCEMGFCPACIPDRVAIRLFYDRAVERVFKMRYEVDLTMLPPGATPGDVAPFCAFLERELGDAGDRVAVVETFLAVNIPSLNNLAWSWPTVEQWERATERYFGRLNLAEAKGPRRSNRSSPCN